MSSKHSRREVGKHYAGDLRRALLDAAAELWFASEGDAVSLREVARHAGVSHAAPAHHFGDRSGLLTALATEGFRLFADHLEDTLAGHTGAPTDQLPTLGAAYAQFAESKPGHFIVMFRPRLLRRADPDLNAAADLAFGALRRHIGRCQRAGWQPQADELQLTLAAWALAHGISVLRAQGVLTRHYPDASIDTVPALVRALLPQHEPATGAQ